MAVRVVPRMLRLVALLLAALVVAYVVLRYVGGVDVMHYRHAPISRAVAIAIGVVTIWVVYKTISSGDHRQLGAVALYDADSSERRIAALSTPRPTLAF